MPQTEIKKYLENRIAELNKADVEFCKLRWDMSRPRYERDVYREQSNSVTLARQELESALKYFNSLPNKKACLHNWVSSVAYKGAQVCTKCSSIK